MVCEEDTVLVGEDVTDALLEALAELVRMPMGTAPSARRAGGTSLPTGTTTCHKARRRTPERTKLLGMTRLTLAM